MIVKKTFGTWIVNWIQTSRMKLMHLPILQCTSELIFYRFSSKFCDFIWQTVLVCWYLLFIIQRWYHVKWPPLANTARAGHTPSFEIKCKNVYTHSTYIIWKWSTINLLTSLMNFDLFSSSYTSYIMCRDENKCIEIQNTKMNKQDTKTVIFCYWISAIPLDLNQSYLQIQIKDIISDFITLTLHEIG